MELDGEQQIAHIELAEAADAIVIAPATANLLAVLAAGLVQDAVSAVACASRAPVVVAPAMDAGMWTHPATQRNVETLRGFGYRIVEPEVGALASGLTGVGRLAEPPTIVDAVERLFARAGDLDGVRVVVSAGGTREPIDPVRFIGNRSSGKMGVAIAEAARDRGAAVTLVAGAMSVTPPRGVETLTATTAAAMRQAILRHAPTADILVMAAAVADFAPQRASGRKIKRDGSALEITLVPNPDIIAEVGEMADDVAAVPDRLRRRERRPGGERRRQAARQGPRPHRRQRGRRPVRRDRLGREQGHRVRGGGLAHRLADASQASGRRAAVGPHRRPLARGATAGAGRWQRSAEPPSMRVVEDVDALRAAILERRIAGDSIGFVPTMGAIHDGQLSLVRRARELDGCVVVSMFRDPAQWRTLDEGADGPRDRARDLALLTSAGADITFLASVTTLYPPDDLTRVTVEGLTRQLEGASRPGHLDGLTTIMLKLIHLTGPAHVFLGQKHAQQVVVLRRMIRDLFLNVDVVACPTVRDPDGLALSSANARLSIEERARGHLPPRRGQRRPPRLRPRRALGGGAARAHDRHPGRRADGASRLRVGGGCRHPRRAPARDRPGDRDDRGLDRPHAADRHDAARLGDRLARTPRRHPPSGAQKYY